MEQGTAAGPGWWAALLRRGASAGQTEGTGEAEYARAVLDLLARCDQLHEHWLQQVDEQRHNERLANAAAVYHWHLNRVREDLGRLKAPPALATCHAGLTAALDAAYRGTQLMSSGYRFYNVRRICDGGLLLEEARAQGRAIAGVLGRLAAAAPTVPASAASATD